MKTTLRQWEREWWDNIIEVCEEACHRGKVGEMYRILRRLATRGDPKQRSNQITSDQFKENFTKVSERRYELEPAEIETVLEEVVDLRGSEKAEEWNTLLNETPEKEKILEEMKKVKDSAPGRNEVRMCYLNWADHRIKGLVVQTVRHLFTLRADRWSEQLKVGIMIPMHKKGSRNLTNNYSSVVLLAMCSRRLARVTASRLRAWTEAVELVYEPEWFQTGKVHCRRHPSIRKNTGRRK